MVALGGFQEGGISMNEAGPTHLGFSRRSSCSADLCNESPASFLLPPQKIFCSRTQDFQLYEWREIFSSIFEFGEQAKFHLTSEFLSHRFDWMS